MGDAGRRDRDVEGAGWRFPPRPRHRLRAGPPGRRPECHRGVPAPLLDDSPVPGQPRRAGGQPQRLAAFRSARQGLLPRRRARGPVELLSLVLVRARRRDLQAGLSTARIRQQPSRLRRHAAAARRGPAPRQPRAARRRPVSAGGTGVTGARRCPTCARWMCRADDAYCGACGRLCAQLVLAALPSVLVAGQVPPKVALRIANPTCAAARIEEAWGPDWLEVTAAAGVEVPPGGCATLVARAQTT